MNYLFISKTYKLIEGHTCENNKIHKVTASDYYSLKNILENNNYKPIPKSIIIEAIVNKNTEIVVATPTSLVIASDSKKISYNNITFVIKWSCDKKAEVEVIDDKKYCKTCFSSCFPNLHSIDEIKKILKTNDETLGLSTSKKIQYILSKSDKKLSAKEIYEKGIPWSAKGNTPKNTVYARISTLFREGIINKDGMLYYTYVQTLRT
jgi:hypothetical protein